MSVERDPDEVFLWQGFSPADPACLLALLAACAERGDDLGRFELMPEIRGALSAEELRCYLDDFVERGEVFYNRLALEEWETKLERLRRAHGQMRRAVQLGAAEAGCVEVLDEALRRAGSVARVITPVPEDLIEPTDRETWPDIAPDLPLRGASLQMDLIGARARAGAFAEGDREAARDCLRSLRAEATLTLFEQAARTVRDGADADDDPNRDRTLMDALAVREMAGEIYALTGDETLLEEIARVDTLLDERGCDALFAVAPSHWETNQDRPPSPDHWWGVRTWAEENGAALVRRYPSRETRSTTGAAEGTGAPVIPLRPMQVREAGTAYQPSSAPAKVIPIERARERLGARWPTAVRAWRTAHPPAPAKASGMRDARAPSRNFAWTALDGRWRASLNQLPDDDTAWELTVIGASGATRVVVGDIERELTHRRARFSYEELVATIARVEHGIGVLAVEIDERWELALLPEPKEP